MYAAIDSTRQLENRREKTTERIRKRFSMLHFKAITLFCSSERKKYWDWRKKEKKKLWNKMKWENGEFIFSDFSTHTFAQSTTASFLPSQIFFCFSFSMSSFLVFVLSSKLTSRRRRNKVERENMNRNRRWLVDDGGEVAYAIKCEHKIMFCRSFGSSSSFFRSSFFPHFAFFFSLARTNHSSTV